MTRKIWTIDALPLRGAGVAAPRPADRDRPQRPPTRPASSASVVRPRPPSPSRTSTARDRMHVVAAYLFGPLAVAAWTSRRPRIAWAVVGVGSVTVAAVLLARWPSFLAWAESQRFGAQLWLAIVISLAGAVGAVWSRAIAVAGRKHPLRPPAWLRHPRAVVSLGLLVPGLGLHLVGSRARAAWAFTIVGPLAASAAILVHWRWLWGLGQSGSPAGLSGNAIEIVLLAAAGTLAALWLVWLVQALDGARIASARDAGTRSDSLSLALLVALGLFALAPQNTRFAQCLSDTSAALRVDGLRLIPLALCDTAARLDPANPRHLADAIELNESLGRLETARAQRQLLESRVGDLLVALRWEPKAPRQLVLSAAPEGSLVAGRFLPAGDRTAWSRIRALTD